MELNDKSGYLSIKKPNDLSSSVSKDAIAKVLTICHRDVRMVVVDMVEMVMDIRQVRFQWMIYWNIAVFELFDHIRMVVIGSDILKIVVENNTKA